MTIMTIIDIADFLATKGRWRLAEPEQVEEELRWKALPPVSGGKQPTRVQAAVTRPTRSLGHSPPHPTPPGSQPGD